ncbi:uncharacterized protein [Populus alba]|uniref:uncharacterized protein isoform X7 n=1 Tax=Populus alba TaxID=43335 RepID=UPI00158D6691|nr:uncharacterized protein LOC118050215 isoform X5 [Populus alba]
MKMVVYSRQKTEKQQQGIGWSTHLSRSRQNLVKNRFLEALQGHHQEYEKCDSPCVDSWAFNCFRDLTIQGLKVSPVPRQASASKAFKGPAWKGRGDACKNYTPFLLDLGEKNNQKCDIPYVL